MLDIQIDNL